MNSKEALFELYKQVKSHTRTTKQIIDNKQQYEQIGKDLNLFEEYKKIEEGIGIDLITLFKALKQGGVYVKYGNKVDWVLMMKNFEILGDGNEITLLSQVKLNPKDYGKTWALTKEELENEIDEKVNKENIKLFKRYEISNSEKNIYTCVCCGKKTCISDSSSIGGAYLVCAECAHDKFNGWHNCMEWQEKMLEKELDDDK